MILTLDSEVPSIEVDVSWRDVTIWGGADLSGCSIYLRSNNEIRLLLKIIQTARWC